MTGTNLPGGPNTFTANYLGDSNYAGGTGTGILQIIGQTNVLFTSPAPSVVVNQPLSVTVTVGPYPYSAVAPTGTLSLSSGTYSSTATPITAGSVTITIPANSLTVGTDTLTASYSGDSDYLPNTNSESVTVTAAPPPGLTLAGTAVNLAPGATTANTSTATLTTSPAGAQDLPTVSFGTTSPVTITGTTAGTATLTISTTAPSTAALTRPALPGIRWYHGGAALACLLLFGIPARRRRWRTLLGMLLFMAFAIGGVISCGGGGSGGGGGGGGGNTNPGTTPGAYVITVTGTQGTVTASTTVNLTVQ
jgi:hypothetical protein